MEREVIFLTNYTRKIGEIREGTETDFTLSTKFNSKFIKIKI